MPTNLSQTDITNLALQAIGAQAIMSITDQTNTSSVACNTAWQLAFLAVAREHDWNCLMRAAVLAPTTQTPITPPSPPPGTTPWAPFTSYAANVYVTYGNALYQALIANVSTASFVNDLTSGYWFETDVFNADPFGNLCGSNYPSGWNYKYPLPADFVKLSTLNDQTCDQFEIEWEIMGRDLFTNDTQAVIKYVANLQDTTIYDSLFVNALKFMLASMIATPLRQDSGAMEAQMLAFYTAALREARLKDGNEKRARRFNPVNNSRIVASRYRSTNS